MIWPSVLTKQGLKCVLSYPIKLLAIDRVVAFCLSCFLFAELEFLRSVITLNLEFSEKINLFFELRKTPNFVLEGEVLMTF